MTSAEQTQPDFPTVQLTLATLLHNHWLIFLLGLAITSWLRWQAPVSCHCLLWWEPSAIDCSWIWCAWIWIFYGWLQTYSPYYHPCNWQPVTVSQANKDGLGLAVSPFNTCRLCFWCLMLRPAFIVREVYRGSFVVPLFLCFTILWSLFYFSAANT